MLTVDEVRAVPLFSTLATPELERLARTSAVGEGSMAIAFVHKYLQQDAR